MTVSRISGPFALMLLFAAVAGAQFDENPHPKSLVRLDKEIPGLIVRLRYNTTNNFVGKRIYGSDVAWGHYRMAARLKKVQEELKRKGYQLVIWDAYRPRYAQAILFQNSPRPGLVARPGNSRHGRGAAVDVTLADQHGRLVPMPSDFDDPSKKGDHNFSDIKSREARRNGALLRSVMLNNGFSGLNHEWWHWDLRGWEDLPYIDGPASPAAEEPADGIPTAPAVPTDGVDP